MDPNAPQNAYLQYDATGATFIIVPDRPGKEVDWDAVAEQVQTAVQGLETELTLNLDDLVEQAKVTAEDPELQEALKEANSYLDLELTYTFTPDGGTTSSVTLDRNTLGSIYYLDPEDMSVQVDEEILGSYVSSLAEQYSAADKSTQFKTTGGSYINISVTQEGQSVDASALYDDMLECLKNKTGGTRTAPYTAVSDSSDGYWGGNYVEIDLTNQHLWLYKNGECILSCGVVSGCVVNNTRTPTGCFQIFAKNTDRYLNGSNIDGSRYRTWVNYFMPFSGGCGIHDATWRSSFGGLPHQLSYPHQMQLPLHHQQCREYSLDKTTVSVLHLPAPQLLRSRLFSLRPLLSLQSGSYRKYIPQMRPEKQLRPNGPVSYHAHPPMQDIQVPEGAARR